MSSISDPDESELGAALHQIRVMERTCETLTKRADLADRKCGIALDAAARAQAAHESERDRRQALEVAVGLLLAAEDTHDLELAERTRARRAALETLRALVAQEKSPEGQKDGSNG